jgi:AcrR family transcriptional regulator
MSPKVTEAHREQRRREILAAAVRVFQRKGYEKTTMQDIVEESGFSRGGVYLYFSGREDLFQALLDSMDADNVNEVEALFEATDLAWDAVELFLQGQEQVMAGVAESLVPVLFEHFVVEMRGQHKPVYLAERYHNAVEALAAGLQKGVERGEFRPTLPVDLIARFLITFLDGIIMEVLYVGSENVQLADQMQTIRATLRQMLGVA